MIFRALSSFKMAGSGEGKKNVPTIAFVREVYDSENALEAFELELERALEAGCDVIVVEPSRLGDETARWIAVGNCLHKTATLSGLGSLASAFIWTDKPYLCAPMCVVSLLCTGVYTLSWQFDPCVHYQVQTNLKKLLAEYPGLQNLTSSSTVVLVRRDVARRNLLQTSVSLLATAVCIWRLYEAFK